MVESNIPKMSKIKAGIKKIPAALATKLLLEETRKNRKNKNNATNFRVVENKIVSLANWE